MAVELRREVQQRVEAKDNVNQSTTAAAPAASAPEEDTDVEMATGAPTLKAQAEDWKKSSPDAKQFVLIGETLGSSIKHRRAPMDAGELEHISGQSNR